MFCCCSHSVSQPARQCSQWPQAVWSQGTPTRSPSLTWRHAGADRDDVADALVAGDERRLRLDRPVALGGVQVGVADAARRDLDQDLARRRASGTGTSSIAAACRTRGRRRLSWS